MELSYHVEKVIQEDIPRLKHGNDGLIYTCAASPYVVGTDERMLVFFHYISNFSNISLQSQMETTVRE